jgi:GxxExxY protein
MKKDQLEIIAREIVQSSFYVHKIMGPGLLESIYQVCLSEELAYRGIWVDKEVCVPIYYRNKPVPKEFRIDLLVEKEIILEIKAIESIAPVHVAQLLSYLKLADKWLGFLLNFNVPVMKDGIRRIVNGFPNE